MSNWFNKECIRKQVVDGWNFIKMLRVEPFLLLYSFQVGMKMMPSHQMVEDKVCTNWYGGNTTYCHDLPSASEDGSSPDHYKTRILGDSAQLGTYTIYSQTPFAVIWALFIGAWIDRYPKARKILIITFCIINFMEDLVTIGLTLGWSSSVYYNLFMNMPEYILCGGGNAPLISLTHYMTSTTPPKLMAVRFMIFQTCITVGLPIGMALGGYIMAQEPVFNSGEVRNYTMVYIISLIFEVLAFLWVIFMINERFAQKNEMKVEDKLREAREKTGDEGVKLRSDVAAEDHNVHPIRLLFNMENVKSMIRTVSKKRPNKGRAQIWFLLLSMGILLGESTGMASINNQFIQRVYLWKPDYISYMGSISMITGSLAGMLIIPIMTKVLNIADIPLALFGYVINFITSLIRGLWLHSNAYYLTMVIGLIGGTASICCKSHMAKIVDRIEMGKILSFLAVLETIAPVIATALAFIFKYTVDSNPGTVYLVVAGLVVVPILSLTWIYIFTKRPAIDNNSQQKTQHNQNNDYGATKTQNGTKQDKIIEMGNADSMA